MSEVAEPEGDIEWYQAELKALRAELAFLREQTQRLGDCIVGLPHEPSENGGAVDAAIRLLRGGAGLIADERQRQQNREGWTAEHDDTHRNMALLDAATNYARAAKDVDAGLRPIRLPDWPWDAEWWKPSDDPIRNLVKAGALIAAEIDRLQRVTP